MVAVGGCKETDVVEWLYKEGDEVDWEEINPSGWKKSLIYNTFYSMEMAKKTVWDSW